jgi:hypothetical protein
MVQLNRGAGETSVFDLNDLPDNVDADETLTISNVTTPTAAGGTVRIDTATQSIFYTPPSSNFTGTDTISYSIGDGLLNNAGEITINVSDFTERNIIVTLATTRNRISGIMLTGTNLLGEAVAIPLTYGTDVASFEDILPGNYVIEIPAIPFLQNGDVPRQIPVNSLADDGDATIDAGIGRLKPEFISIRDWMGSAPTKSFLAVVAPGQVGTASFKSSNAGINDLEVELDASGENIIIRGTTLDAATSEQVPVEATLPTGTDSRVQFRGQAGDLSLLRISVDDADVTFTPVTTSGAEGEALIPINTLTVGDVQAEGESIAVLATTRADVFVPGGTRTESLQGEADSEDVASPQAVDSAMQEVASELTIESAAANEVAENEAVEAGFNKQAIDAVLTGNL